MIWNKTSRKTVFILGAGATRGAFSHVVLNRRRIRAPLNWDFFKIAKTFAAAQRNGGFQERYDRIRKVFREEFPTRGRWPIPMEEAFSLLYVSKDFPEIYVTRGRRRQAGTRKEIEDFLRLTYGILSTIESKAPEQNLYSQLIAQLEPQDTLITLNYDTLVDSALVDAGWDPQAGYGLIGGKKRISWSRQRPHAFPLAGIKLLKLHGSLNWYVKGSFQKLGRVFEAKPSRVLISKPARTNEIHGLVRQIVPPIYGKFFGHKHWREIWDQAYKSLVGAEVLVIIGCSLVNTDFHLSGMLSHAVKKRKVSKDPLRLLVTVDRSVKTRRKWTALSNGITLKNMSYPSFKRFAKACLKERKK